MKACAFGTVVDGTLSNVGIVECRVSRVSLVSAASHRRHVKEALCLIVHRVQSEDVVTGYAMRDCYS
jgi:hypothetical protein